MPSRVKNIFCTFLVLIHFLAVLGTIPALPAGDSKRLELWSAGKSHSDEKPVAVFVAQRFAKAGKLLTSPSTLYEYFRMHQERTDGFVVRQSEVELFPLLENPSALSDRAPPLFV